MPVTVQVENEKGERQGELWMHPDSNRILQLATDDGCCLRFIDPYGSTVFNQVQIPALIQELRAIEPRLTEPAMRLVLRGLLALAESVRDQVHTYIRFIGD